MRQRTSTDIGATPAPPAAITRGYSKHASSATKLSTTSSRLESGPSARPTTNSQQQPTSKCRSVRPGRPRSAAKASETPPGRQSGAATVCVHSCQRRSWCREIDLDRASAEQRHRRARSEAVPGLAAWKNAKGDVVGDHPIESSRSFRSWVITGCCAGSRSTSRTSATCSRV